MLLFPCHPLDRRQVDDHFAAEFAAAGELGCTVGLYDHDRLCAVCLPDDVDDAVLRGWMLPADRYAELERTLAARGVRLRTTSLQYRSAHELPGWYAAFSSLTPVTVWTEGADVGELVAMASTLPAGAAVLKDYVKSLKHLWQQACWVGDARDDVAVRQTAERFVSERGSELQGGLVLRAFEDFQGPEARSWWVDGRCVLVSAHPDTPDQLPADVPVGLAAGAVSTLGCCRVTVDWARRADGVWRVVEVGDAQVSDRPRSMPAAQLLAALVG